jgi:integrase
VKLAHAGGGREAVAAVGERPGEYDLVLMDLHMPDMDGCEAAIGIRSIGDPRAKTLPIIALTAEIRKMLTRRSQGRPKTEKVFALDTPINVYRRVSREFNRAVNELKLNQGVSDRRQRVVIHTLRHSFASWLVQKGTPLYTVSKLMGHSGMRHTERYAHLAPDTQRAAAMELEGIVGGG